MVGAEQRRRTLFRRVGLVVRVEAFVGLRAQQAQPFVPRAKRSSGYRGPEG